MGLKLTLKPGEKIAVNGAVIVNGDRRTAFVIENRANVLRECDIMQAAEATTPARRVYLPVMMMALDPAVRGEAFPEFERRITEFAGVIRDPDALNLCLKISAALANDDFYKALRFCRKLIEFEAKRMLNVA